MMKAAEDMSPGTSKSFATNSLAPDISIFSSETFKSAPKYLGAAAHAFTHIIYKALLLMSAGSVLFMTGKRKCTDLGGLFQSMPITCVCGIIGALAISSFPLTSGFISKSMISQAAADQHMAMAWYMLAQGWEVDSAPSSDGLDGFSMRIDSAGGLWINEQKNSADLNTEQISRAASLISALPEIRERSNQVQRETVRRIAEDASFPGVILEGRDIGTVVFPDAPHKFFLTASEEVRAQRRFMEMQGETPGLTLEGVQEALRERDQRDQTRAVAPLKAAEDALLVDTSGLSLREVVETLLESVLAANSQK